MNSSTHINDGELRLSPGEEKFSFPEKLRRSEMDGLDASQWEELCIAASEDELSGLQKANAILTNDEFKQEVSTYKTLKLKADKQISYPNKNSLKKSNRRIGLWISVVAAAVAILIALPLFISNTDTRTNTYKLAITPYIPQQPEKNHPALADNENGKDIPQNKPVIAQAKNNHSQADATHKVGKQVDDITNTKNNVPDTGNLKAERPKFELKSIGSINEGLAVNSTEDSKLPHSIELNHDMILLASSENFEPIEVERANFFDRLKEKSIVSLNRLRGEGTMVVKEYDSDGKLTLYAVQSNTLSFEKTYTE